MVHAVVRHVDPGGVSCQYADQLVPGRLGRNDQAGRAARRGPDGRLVERRDDRAVGVRLGEERQIMDGHDNRSTRPQRHRVVRGMDDVGVHLLRNEGQPALLPGEPCRPVRDGRRAGHHPGIRHEPAVSLLICPLAGHCKISPGNAQCGDQAVHVSAKRAAVRRNRGRVNQHTRRHDQSRSLLSVLRFPLAQIQFVSGSECSRPPATFPTRRCLQELCLRGRHSQRPRPGCPVRSERTPSAVPPRRRGNGSGSDERRVQCCSAKNSARSRRTFSAIPRRRRASSPRLARSGPATRSGALTTGHICGPARVAGTGPRTAGTRPASHGC